MRENIINKKINILVPKEVTEENIDNINEKMSKIDFSKYSNRNIYLNLSKVEKIDFFGYQNIHAFYKHVKNKLNINITIINKSKIVDDFETKLGITID